MINRAASLMVALLLLGTLANNANGADTLSLKNLAKDKAYKTKSFSSSFQKGTLSSQQLAGLTLNYGLPVTVDFDSKAKEGGFVLNAQEEIIERQPTFSSKT